MLDHIPPLTHRRKLLATVDRAVERLIGAARQRGFDPQTEFHPLDGEILLAVACRFCRASFDPYARLLQREHAGTHVRRGDVLVRERRRRQRPRFPRRDPWDAFAGKLGVWHRDLRRAACNGREVRSCARSDGRPRARATAAVVVDRRGLRELVVLGLVRLRLGQQLTARHDRRGRCSTRHAGPMFRQPTQSMSFATPRGNGTPGSYFKFNELRDHSHL